MYNWQVSIDKCQGPTTNERVTNMKNNRSYKNHGFRYITRNSILSVAIVVDGERVTAWHRSFSEAAAEFRAQIDDITSSR